MPSLVKIQRKDYQGATELSLSSKSSNIVSKCTANSTYGFLKAMVEAIDTQQKAYKALVDLGNNPGKAVTKEKEKIKPLLIKALNLFADAIDDNADGDTMFIINAGFELYKTPVRKDGDIQPVTKVEVSGTGVKGELKITFTVPNPEDIYINVIWLSFDDGQTWLEDYYTKKSMLVVSGLKSGTKVHVKVRTVGTRERKSPWAQSEQPGYVN